MAAIAGAIVLAGFGGAAGAAHADTERAAPHRQSAAVAPDEAFPSPTTGTPATDVAVAAGIAIAVGGLTVFTAHSIRRRPRRSRRSGLSR
jgi:hypothetical protein